MLQSAAAHSRLKSIAAAMSSVRAIDLFGRDPQRAERFAIEAAGLYFDYAKNKIDDEARNALLALAADRGVAEAIRKMAAGERINATEKRAVLHMALRAPDGAGFSIDGENVSRLVEKERARIKDFADRFAVGALRGFDERPLDTIVNIGIGGSDLGPLMAVEALKPFRTPGKRAFFVSNVDGQHLADTLEICDPATTLFIIASKTFTTEETMTNAASARRWMLENGAKEADIARHFIALSTNGRAVEAFGIDRANMFEFWDWVGGRYSMWSAIGMSIALACGYPVFERLLAGAAAMDDHFRTAPIASNMPAMAALVGVWNRNYLGVAAHAVLPYDQHLHRLPAYLQQLDMESNGKSVDISGARLAEASGPFLFGEPGTNGQHAFYQLIHQGTDVIACDFIAAALTASPVSDHHEKLLANFLAQPEALMLGRSLDAATKELEAQGLSKDEAARLAPHKVFAGDRPTNAILMERLTPETLGALVAFYEHKVFVQGVIWGINSFDQWGVELGKALAKAITPEIARLGEAKPLARAHDGSTNALINRINRFRARNGGGK
jgi:glucose-6-phosphate isomerase